MKVLIIAGPYEADRVRRAVVSAGFEAVAVEPGESLSGWITASRPDLIVLAPQLVNADPTVALAKVRSLASVGRRRSHPARRSQPSRQSARGPGTQWV